MNTLNITYKRGTTIAYGAEEACIHVTANGTHVMNILKDEGGFTAYDLEGNHECGGFDVLLRDCKEAIGRVLANRLQESILEQAVASRDEAIDAFDKSCCTEQLLQRLISQEESLVNDCTEPFERKQSASHIKNLRARRNEVRKDMELHTSRAQHLQRIIEKIRSAQ
jgi:hypothetical protein